MTVALTMTRLAFAVAFVLAVPTAAYPQEVPSASVSPLEPPLKPEASHATEPLPSTPGERAGAPQPDRTAAAKAVRERTNAFRKGEGLGPVRVDDRLAKSAQAFADYMASRQVYGHEADGRTPAGVDRQFDRAGQQQRGP